jgi:thioredoxin reductase (NADPH)
MSRYLVERIEQSPRIHLMNRTEVTALLGDGVLEGVVLRDIGRNTSSTVSVGGLFVFIGATPSTNWLDGQLALDGHGFVLTGPDIPVAELESIDHVPLLLETSRPGIFCVGDVRSRSVKRVATAIGEGSIAVRLVFDRLQPFGVAAGDPAARAPSWRTPFTQNVGVPSTPAESTPRSVGSPLA